MIGKTRRSRKQKDRDSRKERRARLRAARARLRARQIFEGLLPRKRTTLPNGGSEYESEEAERADREEKLTEQIRVLRSQLPLLLERFGKISDPRNPKRVKHCVTVVLLTGLLLFIYQMSSRREANREMSRPTFLANLRALLPELESYPHQDTVERLLSLCDVDGVEQTHLELFRRLLRKKKFVHYLIDHCYPLAFDGSQKLCSYDPKSDEWQHRTVGKEEGARQQYYVYVLQASLSFHNGMVLPLLAEFLSLPDGDVKTAKQDCELKAFYRLAERLHQEFPRLPFLLLLDGLYANGPVMALCRKYDWQFIIVLQDDALKSVWEEYDSLLSIEGEKNRCERKWHERRQTFTWANRIDYAFGDNERNHQRVHVVVCKERWQEIDPQTEQVVEQSSRWAWLSSFPLTRDNVHPRCNLAARSRWGIETGFLVEKHQGYQFEHCFAYDWNAMKGYHFLMRLAEFINVLALFSSVLAKAVEQLGKRPLIKFLRETLAGPWLNREAAASKVNAPFQLRFA